MNRVAGDTLWISNNPNMVEISAVRGRLDRANGSGANVVDLTREVVARGLIMDDSATDLEKATVQAPGLRRYLKARLLNSLTRLFLVLVLAGGIISASTPGSHFLETASICLVVAVAVATWLIARYLQLVRALRTNPIREVAKLHKKRKIKNAGFVDAPRTTMDRPQNSEHRYSGDQQSDAYDALRDIDVLGQKSDDGVNRTDDPSRGPIE